MVEDGPVVAACLVAESTGDPALADAGQAHDILPRNIRLKLSSIIRIILALGKASWRTGDSLTGVAFTL
jgi:hypothetical protein